MRTLKFQRGYIGTGNRRLLGWGGASASSFAWASRPNAANNLGNLIRITDVGAGESGTGGGAIFFSNGVRWKPIYGVTIDAIDAPSVGAANASEQQLNGSHVVIPAGLIGNYDRLRIFLSVSKSAAVDSATIRLRFGPLGTASDAVITTITTLATTNQSFGTVLEFKRITATTIQKLGAANTSGNFSGGDSGAYPAAVTVSSMDANPMYLSITVQMTAGTETPTVQDYTLEYLPTDNT